MQSRRSALPNQSSAGAGASLARPRAHAVLHDRHPRDDALSAGMWLAGERVPKIGSALLAVGLLAVPALAYHRQTPPIVGVTFQGDTPLPRVSAGGRRLVLALSSSGRQVFRQDRGHNLLD